MKSISSLSASHLRTYATLFQQRSEASVPAGESGDAPWLLVIDHREARIFRPASVGEAMVQILPPPPEELSRQAPDSTVPVPKIKISPAPFKAFAQSNARDLAAPGRGRSNKPLAVHA